MKLESWSELKTPIARAIGLPLAFVKFSEHAAGVLEVVQYFIARSVIFWLDGYGDPCKSETRSTIVEKRLRS